MYKKSIFALFLFLILTGSLSRAAARPLVYRGVISQEAGSDPYEAFVFENGLGETFALSRVDVGQYDLDVARPIFGYGKVYMQGTLYNEGVLETNLCLFKFRRWDADTLRASTFQQDPLTGLYVAGDDCSWFFEVLVYP